MTGQNHDIRLEQINTDGSGVGGWNSLKVWEDQYEKLKHIVMGMKPGQVQTAGTAFTAVATRMYETVELIYKQSTRLSEHWGGKDAVAAMEQMQKAYDQANEIYQKSHQTGSALENHAKMQQSWQESMSGGHWYGSDWMALGGATGLATRNQQAGELMDQLQSQTIESNNRFPETVRADMPNSSVAPYTPPNRPGGPPGGGGGGLPEGGGLPGGGPGGGSLPDGGKLPEGGPGGGGLPDGGNLPDGGSGGGYPGGGDLPDGGSYSGGGSDLAGLPGGGGGGLGGGLGGGGGGGLPGGGLGGGLGAGGGLPGAGAGAGGVGAGGLGGGLPGAGALGKNGLGAGGMGMGGMPMGAGGGGHGGDGEEHERTTWLTEDEDVWGADGDATPPVIG